MLLGFLYMNIFISEFKETIHNKVQKATDWCQKRNLVMIPVEGPHEDLEHAPPALDTSTSMIIFKFKAVTADQAQNESPLFSI